MPIKPVPITPPICCGLSLSISWQPSGQPAPSASSPPRGPSPPPPPGSTPPPGAAPIKFDQTKKSNDPDGEPREGQHDASSSGKGSADAQPHPAKQPDPQSTPSKSTGVRGEGPGGKAGEGQRTGGAQQKDKEAVEGAKQHSVRKPIPSEGNTPEGRGGSAL
ncbi:hypothetical protein VM1G_11825 [Cytospora mali]|uniref:Uncharacterized protein n=1 Tax=Cytospora mali TaxID=578113 RepID=A0A194W7B7_CYTMA|nr:hypothetical protein VM1G_11825 [Valsa mali]